MAFTAKILSWRFRHLNIVGCLLKRRPTKGGGGRSQAPQDPPLATPLDILFNSAEVGLSKVSNQASNQASKKGRMEGRK